MLSHIHAHWANIDELHITEKNTFWFFNTYRVYSQIFSHFLYHLFKAWSISNIRNNYNNIASGHLAQ